MGIKIYRNNFKDQIYLVVERNAQKEMHGKYELNVTKKFLSSFHLALATY